MLKVSAEYYLYKMEQKHIDRIIEMAWEDRTPYEAIRIQFTLSESEVIALMRRELKRSSFNLWRKRVNSGISQKHAHKRNPDIARFKCSLQRTITLNKISKR
jgi:uncharacterized protein (TIGR03643 family)